MIKSLGRAVIAKAARVLASIPVGRNVCDEAVGAAMNVKRDVQQANLRMTFAVPNALNRYRVDTFATREPDTLTWLDTVLATPSCGTSAPTSVFIRCTRQGAGPRVRIRAFGVQPRAPGAEHLGKRAAGARHDRAPCADRSTRAELVQIVDDGIERFILRSGGHVLTGVQSVLIEINDEFREQAEEIAHTLRDAGLSLHKKCDLGVPHQYNQWWVSAAATNGGRA